jgi:polyphosphate kinase 2 (PPK2 family)
LSVDSLFFNPLPVPIDLTDTGRDALAAATGEGALAALRDRISAAQAKQVAKGGRAIVVLEGLPGSLKTAVIRQLAAALDPRFVATHMVVPDRRQSGQGHWLARFWRDLPTNGRTALYFHSWYGRVLEDRVLGLVDKGDSERAHDEINEFESQQRDHGTLILKLFFHVTENVRLRRLEQDSDQRIPSGSPEQLGTGEIRPAYDEALAQMLAQNNMRWSPWVVIDADQQGPALIAALTAVADAFTKAFAGAEAAGERSAILPMRRPGRGKPA